MPAISPNIYHDIRPIGPSGAILVSHPTGTNGLPHTEWLRLSTSRLYPDLSITSITCNKSSFLPGLGLTNPIFTIAYNFAPNGAEIFTQGTGNQVLSDPFTSYLWFDVFPTGIPNSIRVFTVVASGDLNLTSGTLRIPCLQKQFWGISPTGTYDTTFIDALSNSQAASGHGMEFTVVPTGEQHIFYAYRTAAGNALFTDKASSLAGGFTLVGSGVPYTNAGSFTENYNVWRSDYSGLGTTTITVS